MSLYRRGRVWWSRIIIKGQPYQRSLGVPNKNDARSIESAWRTQILKGEVGLVKAPTVSEFSTRFINYLPARVKQASYIFYALQWKHLTEFPPICNARLDEIDGALIDTFVQHRLGQGVSVVTVNNSIRTLRRALHLAHEWRLITRVPKIHTLPNENQREYVLSEDEITKFVDLARKQEHTRRDPVLGSTGGWGKTMAVLIPFLVDTGLRANEACRLTWADCELSGTFNSEDRYIAILVRFGKTKAARRRVPLTDRAAGILKELKLKARPDVPYVFTRHNGHRGIYPGWASTYFCTLRKELGLPKGCVLHSTRHTFCTRLGEKGATPFEIQKLAGHASITMSARYSHPENAQLERAIGLLNGRNGQEK